MAFCSICFDLPQVWTIYDGGPKTVRTPLICLPPVSGTADTFFQQVLGLSAKGYRVISLSYPGIIRFFKCIIYPHYYFPAILKYTGASMNGVKDSVNC